jgi:hypothetical protein
VFVVVDRPCVLVNSRVDELWWETSSGVCSSASITFISCLKALLCMRVVPNKIRSVTRTRRMERQEGRIMRKKNEKIAIWKERNVSLTIIFGSPRVLTLFCFSKVLFATFFVFVMLLNGDKLKAKGLSSEQEAPSPSSSRPPSLVMSGTISPTSVSEPASPRFRSSTEPKLVKPLNLTGPSSKLAVLGPRSETEPKLTPKLPALVPRSEGSFSSREWNTLEVPGECSPRSRNPSRSPRSSSPGVPQQAGLRIESGCAPAPEAALGSVAPPRPPKMTMSEPGMLIKNGKQRSNILGEILSSEEGYVSNLSAIITMYRDPLVDAKCLDEAENAALFSVYANLFEHHKIMLAEMRERSAEIGTVLNAHLMPMMSLYKLHINRYHEMGELLRSKNENDKNFRRVLAGLSHIPDTLVGLQALEIVRVASVQRLPRYVLLLKELMKCTTDVATTEVQAVLHVIQVLETTLSQLGNYKL